MLSRNSKSLSKPQPGVNARHEVRILSAVPPSVTASDSNLAAIVGKSIKSRLNVDATATISTGRNDAVYYSKIDSEVVTLGPGIRETAHTAEEYTTITELIQAFEGYKDIIMELLKTP